MLKFTIRDMLWLMVVVALAVSWWIDNKRIETTVTAFERERVMQKAEFDDKLQILDDLQKQQRRPRLNATRLTPSSIDTRQP